MRFKLYFDLENEEVPIQYRRCILSFFKLSLSEYSEENYRKFYADKDPIIKPYTFSTYFRNLKIDKESVIVKDKKFEINVSVVDCEIAIILYNAFNNQRYKKFSIARNSWTLKNIEMLNEKKVVSDEIIIKFQSPLCVRKSVDGKDYYFSYGDDKFQEVLKINIQEQLKITDFPKEIVDTFSITPMDTRKMIVKFYEKSMECSTGIFRISGDRNLLEYLYKAGIGSRHSAGFGMFQIM